MRAISRHFSRPHAPRVPGSRGATWTTAPAPTAPAQTAPLIAGPRTSVAEAVSRGLRLSGATSVLSAVAVRTHRLQNQLDSLSDVCQCFIAILPGANCLGVLRKGL